MEVTDKKAIHNYNLQIARNNLFQISMDPQQEILVRHK